MLLHLSVSMEYEIRNRQFAVKNTMPNTWISQLQTIPFEYNLPSAHQLVNHTPAKSWWKRTNNKWSHESPLEQNIKGECIKYEIHEVPKPGHVQNGILLNHLGLQATMVATKACLLVGRYPLT